MAEQTYKLSEQVDITQIGETYQQINEFMPASGPLTIDAGALERCDTAGLQLLLSLKRSFAEKGESLNIVNPSAALINAIEAAGLSQHFELKTEANS